MVFQRHCFCKPQGVFHADPMPDIFLKILLLHHIVIGPIQKLHGQVICNYECQGEMQKTNNMTTLEKKGAWGFAPRKPIADQALKTVGNRRKCLLTLVI